MCIRDASGTRDGLVISNAVFAAIYKQKLTQVSPVLGRLVCLSIN